MSESEFTYSNSDLENEIEILSRKLEEKKAELAAQKKSFSERELVKEAIKERMVEKVAIPKTSPSTKKAKKIKTVIPVSPQRKISSQTLKNFPKEKQLDILVGVAFSASIPEAVLLAEKLKSPYLLDELHDVLVDKFYQELIKRGKI